MTAPKKITVAEKIKDFRKLNTLNQDDFAHLIGVSRQAISKWEREECYPDITLLPTLAALLGCEINDFFT